MNVQLLINGMKERGHDALANVLQESLQENRAPAEINPPIKINDKRDPDVLRAVIIQQVHNSVNSIRIRLFKSDDEEDLKPGIVQLQQVLSKTLKCEACTEGAQKLLSEREFTCPLSCLDHFMAALESLSLEEIIEAASHAIFTKISGIQLVAVWKETKNFHVKSAVYKAIVERIDLYCTVAEDFSSIVPFELFHQIIQDDDLKVLYESDVVDLIYGYRKTCTTAELKKLLSCIRYPYLGCAVFDELPTLFPEVSSCTEYLLCLKSNKWLSHIPDIQFKRRKCIVNHFHILWIENSLGDDSERLGVTCFHDGELRDIVSSVIQANLESTAEARGRCAVVGNKVVIGADLDNQMWSWIIELTAEGLSRPREVLLDKNTSRVEFVDAMTSIEGQSQYTWRDLEHRITQMGILLPNHGNEISCEKLKIPSAINSRRCQNFGDLVIIMAKSHLVIFDRKTQKSKKFRSPADCLSNFLDMQILSNDEGARIFVYDFRMVGEKQEGQEHGVYKDILVVFDLQTMEWQSDPWDIDLKAKNVQRRLYAEAYNGISLFEYRNQVAILAEMGENFDVNYQILFVDDVDDGYYEKIADIKAVSDDGAHLKEILGIVPVDLTGCPGELVFHRYCRNHMNDPQINKLRKMAD